MSQHPAVRPSVRRPRHRRLAGGILTVVLAAAALTACSPIVNLEAAPAASDPACADLVVLLPDTVAEQPARETDAQGTGAWGDPASVLLRCGVPTPGPTTDRCVSVDGIDWLVDETQQPNYAFTTYGRTPAVEVIVDNDVVSGTTALTDLSRAVSAIPAEGGCTSVEDATPTD
ncbi:hypothetical protein BJ978_002934 [Agromyces terreus]|uniref:DUF3515 domain-containing protein n=1 Tax=Agromyces terreus TaxID=424795 RepID=A0A9X2H470_9MICO|nr:DUF3515 domain-containing protein [Agromyces terreus]MCP2372258.1 hypothetical protein [Agromyces terreus]